MYNFYDNMLPEKNRSWRNAYEIEIAAREHEQRRIQLLREDASEMQPRARAEATQQTGLMGLLLAPLRMLATLFA